MFSTSKDDSMEGRNLTRTFLTTQENSRSLISDMAPNPCKKLICTPSFLSHSADSGESMSNTMSPLVRVLALINLIPSGKSSLFLMATSARLAGVVVIEALCGHPLCFCEKDLFRFFVASCHDSIVHWGGAYAACVCVQSGIWGGMAGECRGCRC